MTVREFLDYADKRTNVYKRLKDVANTDADVTDILGACFTDGALTVFMTRANYLKYYSERS